MVEVEFYKASWIYFMIIFFPLYIFNFYAIIMIAHLPCVEGVSDVAPATSAFLKSYDGGSYPSSFSLTRKHTNDTIKSLVKFLLIFFFDIFFA